MTYTMLVGLVQMFTKSGGVISSIADNVIESSDTEKAMTFLLVRCRAWDWMAEDVHLRCFSLMDASRPGWYVRHRYYNFRVEAELEDPHLWTFQRDSSFVLHVDSFYPGYYALEFAKHSNYYARLRDDGYLWMDYNAYNLGFNDAASFELHEINPSRKCHFFCERTGNQARYFS